MYGAGLFYYARRLFSSAFVVYGLSRKFECDDGVVAKTGADFEAGLDKSGFILGWKRVGAGVFDSNAVVVVGNSLREGDFVASGAITDSAADFGLEEFLNNYSIIGRDAKGKVLHVKVDGDFAALAAL